MRIRLACLIRLSLLAVCCTAASASSLFAQAAAGEITGMVRDQGGAMVPGATVTVTNVATNQRRIASSNGDGVYLAPSLPPGEYRVDIELSGFKPVRRSGVRLSTGEKARVDFDLPLVRDRTFFFVDYQGQRQSIAHTKTSIVPTLLQRQGIFTESIAGRVPVIYDPSTTVGSVRTPFANNSIPIDQMDPVALALLQRYPLPTSAGTSNNYTRIAKEAVDQDQWDARVDHRFPSSRDQAFARLSNFREQFDPAIPLPDGSGPTTGAVGPQHTVSWAFASNYQHTNFGTITSALDPRVVQLVVKFLF